MAKLKKVDAAVKAGEDFVLRLSRLAANMANAIAKEAIHKGAGYVTAEIRHELHNTVSEESTGDLEESIGIAPMEKDESGSWNTKIGFDGYDRRETPNQLKARVLESGSSTRPKHPFVRKAVKRAKPKAQTMMEKVIEDGIKKNMEK